MNQIDVSIDILMRDAGMMCHVSVVIGLGKFYMSRSPDQVMMVSEVQCAMLVDVLDVNNSVQLQYWVLLLCSIAMEGTEPSIKIQYTVSSWHTVSMILSSTWTPEARSCTVQTIMIIRCQGKLSFTRI